MAYGEGCPLHLSYAAGHATVSADRLLVNQAFTYNEDFTIRFHRFNRDEVPISKTGGSGTKAATLCGLTGRLPDVPQPPLSPITPTAGEPPCHDEECAGLLNPL